MRKRRAVIDALVTAGARLPPDLAARFGTEVKALVPIGGRTMLDRTIAALRGVPAVSRIIVVGPAEVRTAIAADDFIVEKETGEQNLLAGLEAAASSERTVLCASDMPFVSAAALNDLLERAPASAAAVYPIYTRLEFESAFPGCRSAFARLADGEFTGGSGFVVRAELLLRQRALISKAFGARKNLLALASILGPALTFAFVSGTARVPLVESRASALLGAEVVALRGADPSLAADCDEASDFEYAQARLEGAVQ